MLSIFRRSLRVGIATVGYPHEPEPAPAAYRGQVTLRLDRCVGDGACARVCPSGAIRVEHTDTGWTWELDDSQCVFCGLCAESCPENAIDLTNEFELAVRDPGDLVTCVQFVSTGKQTNQETGA